MQNSDEENQELMRELMVARADLADLNKKVERIGRKIYRLYKKLSAILDKEK